MPTIFNGFTNQNTPATYPNSGGEVKLSYISATSPDTDNEDHAIAPVVDLTPGTSEQIVPGSVRLQYGAKTIVDRNGVLVTDIDPATGSGINIGTIDYVSGEAELTAYVAGANSVSRQALVTTLGDTLVDRVSFRTASAPLRSGSLIIQFKPSGSAPVQTVTSNSSGIISDTYVTGTVDFQTGIVRVGFGQWVLAAGNESEPWYLPANVRGDGYIFKPVPVVASSIRYAAVAYSYIPLDKSILGIDPVRLPLDGRVPVFRVGDVAVVHHTDSETVAVALGTTDLGRPRLSRVWLFDEGDNDARVATSKYTADLDAGTVTLTDITGLTGPIRIEHRIEDMALISDVQINGQISVTRPLSHDFPLGSYVSSALIYGDLQARATRPFDQQTWTNVWSDELIGSGTTAEYNSNLAPVVTRNDGAVTERWALIFTNTTTVRVVGEAVGEVAVLPIASDIAPLNPATGQPYFTLLASGWGGGWAAGNVLRFNTYGAGAPVWIARTVRQGDGTGQSDRFRVQIRGDADNE